MFSEQGARELFWKGSTKWRRLHSEELHGLYSSPNVVRGDPVEKNKVGGLCSTYGAE